MLDLLERAHALMGSVGVSPPRLRRPPSIPPSPPAASNEPPAFASSASGSGASFEEPSTTQLLDSLPPEVCLAVREALLSLPAQAAQADDALEHIIGCLSEHRKRRGRQSSPRRGLEFLVTMDPGQDLDDEMLLVLLAALTQRGALSRCHRFASCLPLSRLGSPPLGLLACRGVITCLAPADLRAQLAAGTLRSLGLSGVPTAAGTDGGGGGGEAAAVEEMKKVRYLVRGLSSTGAQSGLRAGFALMRSSLLAAEDRSLVLVVVSSLKAPELAESWPRAGRELAERWPRDGRELAESWPRAGRELAEDRLSRREVVEPPDVRVDAHRQPNRRLGRVADVRSYSTSSRDA